MFDELRKLMMEADDLAEKIAESPDFLVEARNGAGPKHMVTVSLYNKLSTCVLLMQDCVDMALGLEAE